MMPLQQQRPTRFRRVINFCRQNLDILGGSFITLLGLGCFIIPLAEIENFNSYLVPLIACLFLSGGITTCGVWLLVNGIRDCLERAAIGELYELYDYTRRLEGGDEDPVSRSPSAFSVPPVQSPSTPEGYVAINLAPPTSREPTRPGARTP